MRMIGFLCVALLAGAVVADPSVVLTSVTENTKGVDIAYEVSGRGSDADAGWQLAFTIGGVVASNFTEYAWCDLPVANGAHTVTWDAKADGVTTPNLETYSGAFVAVSVTKAEADYMIVDVSSGKDSATYPVRFAKAGANVTTAQFNKPEYKLHKIAFKRVKVGDFLTTTVGDVDYPYTFRMGNCNTATETAWHPVRLTKDYFLGIFEVTQRQYEDVTGKNPSPWKTKETAIDSIKAEITEYTMMPASQLVYDTMAAEDTGLFPRMSTRAKFGDAAVGAIGAPTEAQWEYACRAGSVTAFHWGADAVTQEGELVEDLYGWNNFESQPNAGVSFTYHGVGELKPNNWGFYDMTGNIYEYCSDWHANSYGADSKSVPVENPTGAASGTARPIRGGAFQFAASEMASGYRRGQSTTSAGSGWGGWWAPCMGIRLAMTIE